MDDRETVDLHLGYPDPGDPRHPYASGPQHEPDAGPIRIRADMVRVGDVIDGNTVRVVTFTHQGTVLIEFVSESSIVTLETAPRVMLDVTRP